MKPKYSLRHFLALAGSSILAITSASAANLTWDITPGTVGLGDSAITGGTGTWNTINGNWTADAGANNIAWTNGDNALITGTAAISIGEAITAGTLTFTSGSVAARTISGSEITINNGLYLERLAGLTWTAPIRLGGSQTWTHNQLTSNSTGKNIQTGGTTLNGHTLTWDTTNSQSNNRITHSAITGTGNIIKNGTGWLGLGANTYTGSTTINTGTIDATNATALGNVNNQLTVNGGTLNMSSISLTVGNLTGTGGLITGSSGTRLLTIGSGDNGGGNFQGVIENGVGGTTALTKIGNGAITLSGTNTYTGATNVDAGVLDVTGTLASAVTVANNAALSGTGTTTGTLALNTGSTIVGTTTGSSFKAETVTASGVAGVKIAGSDGSGTIGSHIIGVVRYNTGTGPDTANFSTAGYHAGASVSNVGGAGGETQLTYTNAARTWNSASGTWDAMTTSTWQEGDNQFGHGDAVTFNDSGTGGGSARAVTVNSLVTPGSVTFNNSTSTPYTVSGTGSIAGLSGLTKTGTGTVVLGNAYNTYSGGTTVTAGTLLVNNTTGSGTGSGTVTVGASGTLGGTGAISGAVNVTGQLSPGASIETFGTGTLSMANSSTLIHELDSSVADAVGSDLLKVTGNLDLAGTVNLTLADLALTDVAFAVNDKFSLINYTGTWNNGLFTFSGNELADEEVFAFGLNTWRISYNDAEGGFNYPLEYAGGTDSFVNITAVTIIPEPGAAFLGSLGLLALLRRRR